MCCLKVIAPLGSPDWPHQKPAEPPRRPSRLVHIQPSHVSSNLKLRWQMWRSCWRRWTWLEFMMFPWGLGEGIVFYAFDKTLSEEFPFSENKWQEGGGVLSALLNLCYLSQHILERYGPASPTARWSTSLISWQLCVSKTWPYVCPLA